ncbi:N-acetylmuramoyl-L-alanine amidase, partial [Nonomuraea angiospora]|nr:N-acetylmuramoyl-L-alanine amidase [Nonomuraea angiospora]
MRRLLAISAVVALPLTSGVVPAHAQDSGDRQQAFAAAAQEFKVPESVLLGVSYLESRWEAHAGQPSNDAGFGPMHLTDAAAYTASNHHSDGEEDARGDEARPLP